MSQRIKTGAYSRNAGARFERECAEWVRSMGFDCYRSAQVKQNNNAHDLTSDDFPWVVECKWRSSYSLRQMWDDLCLTASHSTHRPPMLLWRHARQPMLACVNLAGLKPIPSFSDLAFIEPKVGRGKFWELFEAPVSKFLYDKHAIIIFDSAFLKEGMCHLAK